MRSKLVSSAVVALLTMTVAQSTASAAGKRKTVAPESAPSDTAPVAVAPEAPLPAPADSTAPMPSEVPAPSAPAVVAPEPQQPVEQGAPTSSKQSPAEETYNPVEPPVAPMPGDEPIPATGAPAPQTSVPYVEHLGPNSFPGRQRGIYGGSLWLEPSFHGLQWPYMAHTGLGVSGQVWVDSGWETIHRDPKKMPNTTMFLQQGRGVMRFTPTYVSGRFFIQGQIELVGNSCQTQSSTNAVCAAAGTFSTDDLWIRFGHWNIWDLKIGRFEAWEIYHLGMGMDQYSTERMGAGMYGVDSNVEPRTWDAPAYYGVNYLHDRPSEGLALGYVAGHVYFTHFLRIELLGKLGSDNNRADNSTSDTASTSWGGRATTVLDFGWLKLKGGREYSKRHPIAQTVDPGPDGVKKDPVPERTNSGYGGSAILVNDRVEGGLSYAQGTQSDSNAMAQTIGENSFTTKSFGGFANVKVSPLWVVWPLLFWALPDQWMTSDPWTLGAGLHYTTQTDEYKATSAGSTTNNYTSHLQGFFALQYALAGQLFIKGVFGYAKAYFQPSDVTKDTWSNHMYSARIRLMYVY
jgi:hypothetical protein